VIFTVCVASIGSLSVNVNKIFRDRSGAGNPYKDSFKWGAAYYVASPKLFL
jgi:hypothetical protein